MRAGSPFEDGARVKDVRGRTYKVNQCRQDRFGWDVSITPETGPDKFARWIGADQLTLIKVRKRASSKK